MTTTYFLHGGRNELNTESNKKFYTDIINHFQNKNLNILCIYFARPIHRWEDSFKEDIIQFKNTKTNKKINLEMGQLNNLKEQISNSDIIFFAGGRNGCLKEKLLELDTEKLFEDKLIVGISAGANILSKYYYSSVAGEIREGIGILPIKIFTHFSENKDTQLNRLKDFGKQIPIYTVREQEYIKIIKE